MTGKMPDFSNVQSGSSSTAEKIYTVVSGDSLSKIAKREYGKANDWPRIFEANKEEPPKPAPAPAPAAAPTPPPARRGRRSRAAAAGRTRRPPARTRG
jgi:nucleoid-associated protein YgaU